MTSQRMCHLKDLEDGKMLGDSGEEPGPPENFDLMKFHRGRYFFREHIFCCSIGMFFSLIIGMCFPELLEALVYTENSNTPRKAFKRYMNTYRHVALWHYGDVWQTGSEANKSILLVREMHKKISKKMKEEAKDLHGKEFLSQYDMGVVQSGFMGFACMYSQEIGINCSQSDIDDYIYFWYGIGHLLGIKKQYNICAHGFSQALLFCKDIEGILLKNLQEPPSDLDSMTAAVINGFRVSETFTLLTLPVIKGLSFDAMKQKLNTPLRFGDTVRFYIWRFIFFSNWYFPFFRKLLRAGIEKVYALEFTSFVFENK